MEVSPEPLQSELDTLSKLCGDVVKVGFEYLAVIRSRWESSQLPLPQRREAIEKFAEEMAEEMDYYEALFEEIIAESEAA